MVRSIYSAEVPHPRPISCSRNKPDIDTEKLFCWANIIKLIGIDKIDLNKQISGMIISVLLPQDSIITPLTKVVNGAPKSDAAAYNSEKLAYSYLYTFIYS